MAADWTWEFEREGDRLIISRSADPDATVLVLAGDYGTNRALSFPTHDDLVRFQGEFEQHLLDDGWRFVVFTPERRSGVDRRQRTASDRRLLPFRHR